MIFILAKYLYNIKYKMTGLNKKCLTMKIQGWFEQFLAIDGR